MGLITQTVQVKPNNNNIKYYSDLGYDSKPNKTIEVKVSDLPRYSTIKVNCTCDYCGKQLVLQYSTYNRSMESPTKKISCSNCVQLKIEECNMIKYGVKRPLGTEDFRIKIAETNIKRYGVENPFQLESVKEKIRQTNINKYGVENVMYSKEIHEKIKKHNIETHGVEYLIQTPEVRLKAKQTMLERYGVENASSFPIFQEKTKQTNRERYGVDYPSQNDEIRAKMINSFYTNQSVATSIQQQYLGQLYNMQLNYPISRYNVDLYEAESNIVVGYDGGGHWLSVELRDLTQEEFDRKQMLKEIQLRKLGYKLIRIISRHDYLPSDSILLQMLSDAKQYFNDYPNHSWVEYDIDNNTIRNAENLDGIFYCFGNLRTIRKKAS